MIPPAVLLYTVLESRATERTDSYGRYHTVMPQGIVAGEQGLEVVHVEWVADPEGGRPQLVELEGTEEVLPCDLALLAMGFLGPEATLAEALGVQLDPRSNFKADFGRFATSIDVRIYLIM